MLKSLLRFGIFITWSEALNVFVEVYTALLETNFSEKPPLNTKGNLDSGAKILLVLVPGVLLKNHELFH